MAPSRVKYKRTGDDDFTLVIVATERHAVNNVYYLDRRVVLIMK